MEASISEKWLSMLKDRCEKQTILLVEGRVFPARRTPIPLKGRAGFWDA